MMEPVKRSFLNMFKNQKGSENRIRIMKVLLKEPLNMNQLAKKLDINNRTAKHHIDVLVKEEIVSVIPKQGRYGGLYSPSNLFKSHLRLFYDMIGDDPVHIMQNSSPFCRYQYICNEFCSNWLGKCLQDKNDERSNCDAYVSITEALARV